MAQIVPQRSLQKGVIQFQLICDCGRDHTLKIAPKNLSLDVVLMRKGKALDHVSITPPYRPKPVV